VVAVDSDCTSSYRLVENKKVKHENTNYVVKGDTLIRVLFGTISLLILSSLILFNKINIVERKSESDIAVLKEKVSWVEDSVLDWQTQRDVTYHDNIVNTVNHKRGVR
jgi:hypothetical protein